MSSTTTHDGLSNLQTTNSEINTELVLTNLKIIANLKPDDKLTKEDDLLIIDTPYFGQGSKRWWNGDSRGTSLAFIEKLINDAFEIIDSIYSSELEKATGTKVENNYYYKHNVPKTYFKTENSQQLQTFSNELNNAIKGLQNLKITYKNDISICSKIDVNIEKINIRINKITNLLTSHHPSKVYTLN